MSYKNNANTNPLIAVYASSSVGPSSAINVKMELDTSLQSGSVSSYEYTNPENISIFGDWYGSANQTGFFVFPYFQVDNVEQNQGIEYASGYSASFRGNDVIFANASKNTDVEFFYKRGTASAWKVTTNAGYPRMTGVTTK